MSDKQNQVTLSKSVVNSIVDAVSHQIPLDIAAEANGMSSIKFLEFIRMGQEDLAKNVESVFTDLVVALRKAEMRSIREHLEKISARADNWEAHAFLLERRWPQYYSLQPWRNKMKDKKKDDKKKDGSKVHEKHEKHLHMPAKMMKKPKKDCK